MVLENIKSKFFKKFLNLVLENINEKILVLDFINHFWYSKKLLWVIFSSTKFWYSILLIIFGTRINSSTKNIFEYQILVLDFINDFFLVLEIITLSNIFKYQKSYVKLAFLLMIIAKKKHWYIFWMLCLIY